jgi:cytochrome b involved in lipid metabolism
LTDHPGGIGNIMTYAGRDATAAFKAQNHSQTALKKLYEY